MQRHLTCRSGGPFIQTNITVGNAEVALSERDSFGLLGVRIYTP